MTASRLRRALVLDLDGVLLDTRPVMRQAWREVRERHGINVPFEAYEQHLGRPFDDIMEILGLTEVHAFAAADWLLGVVTSKPLDRAAPLLARLGCPFAAVRTPSGPGRGKPAPDPLMLAIVDLATDPASALFVGDMAVDRECARRAGVPYVHAAWGYGEPGSPTPEIARDPQDLLRVLDTSCESGPFVAGSLL